MNKFSLLLAGFLFVSPALCTADEASTSFWNSLRLKIEQLMPQKQLDTTTAVGGVRGAPVENNDIYWKGEDKPVTMIDPKELAAFQNALSLVDAGKKTEAIAAFTSFGKKYPHSPLRKDAEQALAQLNAR